MRQLPRFSWQDAYDVIEPQITANSVHEWPFAHDFPVDVKFLRFGSRNDIRMNRHDYLEMMYIVSGSVTYQVHEQFCKVSAGDLFIVGSTLMHRIARYHSADMKAVVLYFLPDILTGKDASATEELEYLMPFRVQDELFPHVVAKDSGVPQQIFDLMVRVDSELPASTNRARLSVRTYLRMMLVLLVNHFANWSGSEQVFEKQQSGLQRLKPLFDFIDRHYAEVITVEAAADIVHMSKSSFMRFFREVTGQSFVGYLNRFRIARAEVLLARTDLPIAEISQRVGFCDQSYFGLTFRNLLDMTPREYKNRVRSARASS
jgi:AraC-like DNA-binding protein